MTMEKLTVVAVSAFVAFQHAVGSTNSTREWWPWQEVTGHVGISSLLRVSDSWDSYGSSGEEGNKGGENLSSLHAGEFSV
jgi:hypothetical protein